MYRSVQVAIAIQVESRAWEWHDLQRQGNELELVITRKATL